MRKCSKCGKEITYNGYCKECRNEYGRNYNKMQRNRDKYNQYYAENREVLLARSKEYQRLKREKIKECKLFLEKQGYTITKLKNYERQ